jgi:uncharacterized protein (TIGR02391 family)
MTWLTPEEILRVPSETLGILILHRLTELDENHWGMHNFTTEYLAGAMPSQPMVTSVYSGNDLRARQDAVVAKIADAWTWLEQQRYLVPSGRPGEQWRQLTERGSEILKVPVDDALKRIQAGALLGPGLHPRIERQVREAWNAGDFETAIFKAAREIEIAVGERLPPPAPGDRKLYGVEVINAAFGKGKPLADPGQDPGEQEGTRALYAGFIGTFKNPGSHRHFEPDDPVQAAEIIRTADLLMRMLDDITGQSGPSSP